METAHTHYLRTLAILSVHFPISEVYASCLKYLGDQFQSMKVQDQAESSYFQALAVYSVYFPPSEKYALCLNLALLYGCLGVQDKEETAYLQALTIYSAHFPLSINYAISLYNLGFGRQWTQG